ncbi:hypothetical protein M3Y94_01252900 [Aphelenchoides besseyi]|nr:hypothetical protein M3Y94_01252900 [Aphelenchoides besseyi]KAI6219428.1 hypothetical protein M3Y95_01110200 [Aphelenchoides besseyi]
MRFTIFALILLLGILVMSIQIDAHCDSTECQEDCIRKDKKDGACHNEKCFCSLHIRRKRSDCIWYYCNLACRFVQMGFGDCSTGECTCDSSL